MFGGNKGFEGRDQRTNVALHNSPNDRHIDLVVIVHESVPQAVDSAPFDFRMSVFEPRRDLACRFADNL